MQTLEKTISLEEYLQLSEASEEKLEYLNGEVIAMAGTTLVHEFITQNLIDELRKCLRKKGCVVLSGQVKLYTSECEKAYFYPDIHIYCQDKLNAETPLDALQLSNPDFIIEVLSKSTRSFDRGAKFDCYRQIKSLQKYVMVESQLKEFPPAVYIREWEDDRRFTETRLELEEKLDVLGCQINIQEVYDLPNFKK